MKTYLGYPLFCMVALLLGLLLAGSVVYADEPDAEINVQASAITFQYDAAGRLTTANYSSQSLAYTYDLAGNLVKLAASGGSGYDVFLPLILKQK